MTLPTIDELLQLALNDKVIVAFEYQGLMLKKNRWHVEIFDSDKNELYSCYSTSFNEVCEFIHQKLKEI